MSFVRQRSFRLRPLAAPVEIAPALEQGRVIGDGHRGLAGDPGQQLPVRHVDQLLELAELVVAEVDDRGIDEPAHDQVHLPHAAMPAAEQQLPPAHIQPFTRTRRTGHQSLANSNAKSPDWPGEAYIAVAR